jgi:hypothetical protein
VTEPWLPLELEGYGGTALPCLLHSAANEVGIAVVLSGGSFLGGRVGGTPARPELRYTRALLKAHGLSVLEVRWQTDPFPEAGAHVVELPGADHSLEVADPAESARLLAGVLDELGSFLARVPGATGRSR